MSLCADKGIDYRRLAGIGPAYDGKLGYVVEGFFVFVGLGQVFDHLVEEVAGAVAVDGRYWVWVAKAEAVELGHIVDPLVRIDLVGH